MEVMRCGGRAYPDPESSINASRCDRCLAVIGSIGQPDRCKRLNEAEALSFPGITGWVMRNGQYPGRDRDGSWDVIEFTAVSTHHAERFSAACERKFWRRWIVGKDAETGEPAGLLYKPSGASAPWEERD